MSEQLPVDLEHAVWYCAHASLSRFTPDDDARKAADAIRAEHAQRINLQYHACDLAQRVADLEAENIGLSDAFESEGYVLLLNYIKELDAAEDMCGCPGAIAAQLLRDQQKEIAELEAERANTAAHVASIARQLGDEALQVDDIAVRVLGLVAERDELRKELDCAEEAADVAACSLVSEDSDGYECVGSYIRAVTQQLVKERDELRARLAVIEAQEPVVWAPSCANQEFAASVRGDGDMLTVWFDRPAPGSTLRGACQTPLYARPVPAIPADPGMLTVSMAPSSAYAMGWNDCRAKMINAAPEHKS